MRYSLSDEKWLLMGHWPYTPLRGRSMETGEELQGITDWIEARVPGSVQDDLRRAGLIPDPYYAMNSLQCEWVENRWWRYRCRFAVPENARTERVLLNFDGVDYAAHVYLNGVRLGWHEGMYEPFAYDVKALLKEENVLEVLIEDAPKEQSQIGYTSLTETQKARFGYKWDFCTHLVNLGIWEDVSLDCTGFYRLKDVFTRSDVDEQGFGIVRVSGIVDGYRGQADMRLSFALGGNTCPVDVDPRDGAFDITVKVENPDLWHANGTGGQPLYAASLTLFDGKGVSDTWQGRIGIRSLRYRRTDGASADALPYTVVLNGSPVYLKGVNMTPLSHFYGALREKDYRRVLTQAKRMGVNLIRVWGGGICEKKLFYDICDEYGILVWQEFIQSSSGLDNIPSKKPHFLKLLAASAEAMLKGRRSCTCHAFWSGGNELMDATDHPVNVGDENIHMLAGLCARLDPDKQFMPSSASGPTSWLLLDQPGRNHDVHGNWKYEGIPAHYARYNASDAMLHTEFGCDGLSGIESLERILPPEHLRPTDMRQDLVWRFHGEWWDCYDRDTDLFGTLTDLKKWTMLSQFIQAEGIRYILEANRRRAYGNCGSFIWQINEPWYNTGCTCLIEHNGTPKMAAESVRKAFAPVNLSLKYDTLIFPAGKPMRLEAFISNSLEEKAYTAGVALKDVRGAVLSEARADVRAKANGCTPALTLEEALPAVPNGLIWAILTLKDADGAVVFENEVLFTQTAETPFAALQSLPQADLRVTRNKTDGSTGCGAFPDADDLKNLNVGDTVTITNAGDTAAVFVHPVPKDRAEALTVCGSRFTLFPNETRAIHLEEATGAPIGEILIRSLNAPDLPA